MKFQICFQLCLSVLMSRGSTGQVAGHAPVPGGYDVVQRPTRLLLKWAEIEDEAKISFDGSVAAIQALALEKATALDGGDNKGDTGNGNDALERPVPVTCDAGTWTQNVHAFPFQYMVEYEGDPSNRDQESTRPLQPITEHIREIVLQIEKEVQNKLANSLLICRTEDEEVQEANIVGLLARTPKAGIGEDMIEPCAQQQPNERDHLCANVEGRLTLFLGDDEKEEVARFHTIWSLKKTIEDTSLITKIGRGLIKVTYLRPAPMAPYQPSGSADSSTSVAMNARSVAFVSVGAATAMVLLAVALVWRRQFTKDSTDMVAFESPGTRGVTDCEGPVDSSDEEIGTEPASPFSRMIPTAYQYSDHLTILSGTGLSAVTEVSESEGTPSINSQGTLGVRSPLIFSEDASGIEKSIEMLASPTAREDSGPQRILADLLVLSTDGGNDTESIGDGGISDISPSVSPSPSDESEEHNHLRQLPSATTSLLLDISSPTGTNTAIHEDEDLLFLK